MKLSKCIQYINTALNFPALTYIDINLFFDSAISELNTTLHTSIPPVSVMIEDFRQYVSKYEPNKIVLSEDPADDDFIIPSDPVDPLTNQIPCYYDSEEKMFYVLNKYTQEYAPYKVVKAVYLTTDAIHLYQSMNYGSTAIWMGIPTDPQYECVLDEYLPDDWVLLWLIPYICFKYTVRDGGTAQTFAEELTQGFQQLQETYDVPDKVLLATYADKFAYRSLVEKHLPNINIYVPTMAIYENMKHSRNTNAIFGSFYDRGGF